MKWVSSRENGEYDIWVSRRRILTGTIRTLPNFASDDMRLVFYDFFKEPKFSQVMKLLTVLDEIAKNHNAPVAQVAVNWNALKDFVTTSLCGTVMRKKRLRTVLASNGN